MTSTKFLGVPVDRDLTFKDHVDEVIKKTDGRVYSLLDLERSGVLRSIMKKFYMTYISAIILYACPSWCTITTAEQRLRVEKLENLALKGTDPSGTDYEKCVTAALLPPILDLLDTTSKLYFSRIMGIPEHCSHQLAPSYTPAALPRRSARLSQPNSPPTRTDLRSQCPLIHN